MAKDRRIDPSYVGVQVTGARVNPTSRQAIDAGVSFGLTTRTAFEEAQHLTLGGALLESSRLGRLQEEGPTLDQNQIDESLKEARISPDEFDLPNQVTAAYLDDRISAKKLQRQNAEIIQAGSKTVTGKIGVVGASLLAVMTDPAELATMFIPTAQGLRFGTSFVRGASRASRGFGMTNKARSYRRAQKMWDASKARTILSKMDDASQFRWKVREGIIDGAVGNLLTEPFVYGGADIQQIQYGMVDSLMAVSFGGALGGGLQAGLGVLTRVARRLGFNDAAAAAAQAQPEGLAASQNRSMPRDVRVAVSRTAMSDVSNGRSVNVEQVQAQAGIDFKSRGEKLAIVDEGGQTRMVELDARPSKRQLNSTIQAITDLRSMRGKTAQVTETFADWFKRTGQHNRSADEAIDNARAAGYFKNDPELTPATLREKLNAPPRFRDEDEALFAAFKGRLEEARPVRPITDPDKVGDYIKARNAEENLEGFDQGAVDRARVVEESHGAQRSAADLMNEAQELEQALTDLGFKVSDVDPAVHIKQSQDVTRAAMDCILKGGI